MVIVGEKAAEEEEMSHTRKSESERETAAFALFIADITWLGNLRKKVCVLSNSERVLDTEKYLHYT